MEKQQGKTPQVRFPEFNDVWEQKAIGDVFELNARPINKPLDNYKSIGIRSHFKGTFQRLDSDPSKNVMDTLFEVKENDLIVNITFAWEGAVAIASKDDEGGLVSHRFPTYINDKKKVDIDFFRFLFPTPEFKRTLTLISPGSAGRNRVLKKSDFLKIKFLFPTLPEQTRIASFLTVLDKKIAQLKQKKTLLEQYKKGVMQKLFSQELRFKDENGNEFPKWEKKYLRDLVEFRNGKAHEQNISEDGKYIVVNSKFISMEGEVIKYSDYQICPLEFGEIAMVMSDVPNGKALAKCFFVDENDRYTLNQRICALKAISIEPRFLQFILNRNRYYLLFDSGVGQTNLTKDEVLNCPLKVPSSREEQKKILNFINSINSKIDFAKNLIQQTQEYKKGLLQNMFC
ncbi:MAG: restriction endonuclease subunit S [Saprospiraceae bacterium]|nr:MAG: restriction endonuclease subunit S [Saprospiraceae bacterium]